MRRPATIFVPAALALLLAAGCTPGTGDADDADPTAEGPVPTPGPAPAPAADSTPAPEAGNSPPGAPAPAHATVPERFRGTWAANATACALTGDPSHLDIGATDVAFHESTGPVTGVEADGGQLTLTLRLSGEGDTWEATYGFRLSDDGQSLVADDGGMTRRRCG